MRFEVLITANRVPARHHHWILIQQSADERLSLEPETISQRGTFKPLSAPGTVWDTAGPVVPQRLADVSDASQDLIALAR